MKEITQKTELNMHAWADKLKEINPKLAEVLGEDRNAGFENLEKFDLPRYKTITLPVTKFLANPHVTFEALGTNLFNIILLPKKEGLKRMSAAEIDEQRAINFIKENAANEDGYLVKIIQYYDNKYGGGIIIDDEGNIHLDLKPGQNTELAYGTVVPEYTAQSRNFTKTLDYSFENPELRTAIYNTLKCIPHDKNQYLPGNYEFLLVQKSKDAALSPIFWDCRPSPKFYEANKNKLIERQKSQEQLEIERRLKNE